MATVNPAGVRPNVSVGNKGLAPARPVPVLGIPKLGIPDAAAFAAGAAFVPKAAGFDTGAVGAVVGKGNWPQLVVRVVAPREEPKGSAGVAIGIILAAAEPADATPAELVNGGTGNDGGFTDVVEGSVFPFVALPAEAPESMGRPARSTFWARACLVSAKEGGTDGKLNPEPAASELSGFRIIITRGFRAAFKTRTGDSMTSSGMATEDESSACCTWSAFVFSELVVL